MKCSMETELGAYVLDALEPEETDDVQRHLSGCQTCQSELSSLTATVSWLALLDPDDVVQLEQEIAAPTPPRRRRRLATFVTVEAGLAFVVVALGAAMTLTTPARHAEPVWPLPFRFSVDGLVEGSATRWRALMGGQVAAVGVIGLIASWLVPRRAPLRGGALALVVVGALLNA